MDYKKTKAEFEKIQKDIERNINPIFKNLIKKQDKLRDDITPVDYNEWNPPCGIFENTAALTEEQKQEADEIVDKIVNEVLDDPEEAEEIKGMAKATGKGQAGTGKGNTRGYVEILRLRFPEWLKDIKSSLKDFFATDRIRKGLDYEEAVKGVIRKPKDKVQNPEDALYVFIDTSGSMFSLKDKNGVGLLRLFASYFPQIAKEYNGEIWLDDYAAYNDPDPIKTIIPLEDFKKGDITRVDFGGGGGTEFWGVWQYFDKKVREAKSKNPKARVTLIFFSDMFADFSTHAELIMDKDVLFVTVEGGGIDMLTKTPNVVNGTTRRLILADTSKPLKQ